MPVLAQDIVNAVITELSQVPGIATQIYSAGRILQHVQDAFLMEFEDFWWPDYLFYSDPIPLDGITGKLTLDVIGPLGPVTEYRDIKVAWPSNWSRPLREVPQSINPFAFHAGSDGRAWYMMPDYTAPNRPMKVFPSSASGSVIMQARSRPALPFGMTTKLYLDQLLLQYDAAWMYTVDDGTVPAQVNKFQVLATNRRKMVKASFGQQPLELDPRYPDGGLMQSSDSGFFVLDEDPLA